MLRSPASSEPKIQRFESKSKTSSILLERYHWKSQQPNNSNWKRACGENRQADGRNRQSRNWFWAHQNHGHNLEHARKLPRKWPLWAIVSKGHSPPRSLHHRYPRSTKADRSINDFTKQDKTKQRNHELFQPGLPEARRRSCWRQPPPWIRPDQFHIPSFDILACYREKKAGTIHQQHSKWCCLNRHDEQHDRE